MFLFINTVLRDKLEIALVTDKVEILEANEIAADQNHSERLLPEIENILKRNNSALNNLKGIGVVLGPGSFTGVRVGVTCANALGFALNIPVKGVKYQINKDLIKTVFRNFEIAKNFEMVVPLYS